MSTIQAKKSFYNLSKRQQQVLEKPEPLEHGLWILSGFAGEWTGDGEPKQGFSKVKFFRGMQAEGKVARESSFDGFDYLFFEALYNEYYDGPNGPDLKDPQLSPIYGDFSNFPPAAAVGIKPADGQFFGDGSHVLGGRLINLEVHEVCGLGHGRFCWIGRVTLCALGSSAPRSS